MIVGFYVFFYMEFYYFVGIKFEGIRETVEIAKDTLLLLAEGRHYECFTINKIGMPCYFYFEQG